MTSFEVRIDRGETITLPVPVRDRLHVDAGDSVVFTETPDGTYRFHARDRSLADLRGIVKGSDGGTISNDDVTRWIDEARGSRYQLDDTGGTTE